MSTSENLLKAMHRLERDAGIVESSKHTFEDNDPWSRIKRILQLMGYTFYSTLYTHETGLQPAFEKFLSKEGDAHQDMIGDALATVCDAMGVHPECNQSIDATIVVLAALSRRERWRYCLKPGHDPHALARNMLLVTGRSKMAEEPSRDIGEEWLGVELKLSSQELLSNGLWAAKEDAVQKMTCAMFGDHWWLFNSGNTTDVLLDADLVVQQRPDFKAGLVPGLLLSEGLTLPDMSAAP